MHGGGGGAGEHARVERRQQGEVLAALVLALVRLAVPGEVGVLADEAGRRGLAAGVRVGARVEHQHLDRSAAGEHARHRTEADVVAGSVSTDREHVRHERELVGGEVVPRERAQFLVVDGRVVGVLELEARLADRLDLGHLLGGDAFVDARCQRLGVLEQAVDPRVEVRRERHRRRVHRRATGGVGDHGGGGSASRGSGLGQVQRLVQLDHEGAEAVGPLRVCRVEAVALGLHLLHEVLELLDVRGTALVTERTAHGRHEANGRDLTATAACTVATGGGVVVGVVEQHALDVAVGRSGALGEALGSVGQLAHEGELLFERGQHVLGLVDLGQGAGATHLDALEAARALPRVHRGGEQAAAAGDLLLHRVEERARARHREGRQGGHEVVQVTTHRLVGVQALGGLGHHVGERAIRLVLAVGLAHPLGERVHLGPQRLALALGRVNAGDARQQQVVDLVNCVRDRDVGAHHGAVEAARALGGVEHRRDATEQSLVLGLTGSDRHEHAGTRQDGRLADGALAERACHQVLVVGRVEEVAGARLGGRGAHRRRDGAGVDQLRSVFFLSASTKSGWL